MVTIIAIMIKFVIIMTITHSYLSCNYKKKQVIHTLRTLIINQSLTIEVLIVTILTLLIEMSSSKVSDMSSSKEETIF